MAPSPTDPGSEVAGSEPDLLDERDPLAELRRAVAAPSPDWLSRGAGFVDDLRSRSAGRVLVSMAVVAMVVAAGLAGYALWRGAGSSGAGPGGDVAATLPRASASAPGGTGPVATTAPGSTATRPGAAGELVVQASGAVVRPGLYHLASGSRVGDLVDEAGGATPDADLDRVNLAAPLTDGVRVWVPRRGETDPPAEVPTGGGSGGSAGADGPAPLVDLNTATADELDALPGIGPATAAAIIDHRQRNGPFTSVDELADVRGIGDAKLAELRDLVRV